MTLGALGVFAVPGRAVVVAAGVRRDLDLERVDGTVVLVDGSAAGFGLQREGEVRDGEFFAEFQVVVGWERVCYFALVNRGWFGVVFAEVSRFGGDGAGGLVVLAGCVRGFGGIELREELFLVGEGRVQGWFEAEGRDGPLPLVVDWRAFGGGVIVVGVVLFGRKQVVCRSGDAEGARHGVLADLDERFFLKFVDAGGDGSGGGLIRDGLPGEDGLADVAVFDLVVVGYVREGWQDFT